MSRPTSSPPSEMDARIDSLRRNRNAYACLICDNLPFLERQCRKAAARHVNEYAVGKQESGLWEDASLGNAADELFVEVLDRLCADDFQSLRRFKGKAKLTTYLTTIISNLVVDIQRSKYGRNRGRERARELGPVAETLHDLVHGRGYSLAAAHEHLKATFPDTVSEESLAEVLVRIKGREVAAPSIVGVPSGLLGLPIEEYVADQEATAEEQLIDRQRELASQEALDAVLADLSPDELLMLRMRYPTQEDQTPLKISEIARCLDLNEKVVDSRLKRILQRGRKAILARGLRLDDLIGK